MKMLLPCTKINPPPKKKYKKRVQQYVRKYATGEAMREEENQAASSDSVVSRNVAKPCEGSSEAKSMYPWITNNSNERMTGLQKCRVRVQ
jgi:hypothetical protein